MIQVIAQFGDLTFCATTDSGYNPEIVDDMCANLRRAIMAGAAQLELTDE